MAFTAYRAISSKTTPQSEPIPGSAQVPNSAGGFAWSVDPWTRMQRFLVLGSEGGSYYAGERKLTLEGAAAVRECLALDAPRAVSLIEEISHSGRAPKNDPALFALALAASAPDTAARRWAFTALPLVARTGTHLFHFVAYVTEHRGWGRNLRSMIADWYASKPLDDLAYQLVKYQSRDGWSHRDLLRLAHPKATGTRNDLYRWAVKGWDAIGEDVPEETALRVIWAFERAKRDPDPALLAHLIRDLRLPREGVPTEALRSPTVWDALLDGMPMTALVRNLANLTRAGLLGPMGPRNAEVAARLEDGEALRKARVHPLQMLVALKTYEQGHGDRGKATWDPARRIVDALDRGFYASYGTVEPTNKRLLLALDVSGSMEGPPIAGMPGISPRVGAAAMALVTANVEPIYAVVAFQTTGSFGRGASYHRSQPDADPDDGLKVFPISPRQRLDDVVKATRGLPFGGTDCSLPMLWALKHKLTVDAFIIYTDSETWAGAVHPAQALARYRQEMGIPAKLVVVGMVSNGFSIADPNDPGMLDVVGFDLATPNLISDFVSGA